MRKKRGIFLIVTYMLLLVSVVSNASTLFEGKLKNGLAWKIYKNSNDPIISVDVMIKAGSIFDPIGKFGLAYVTAKSLENCSTPMLSNSELRKMFDKYGIISSVSVNKGFINISFVGLSKYYDRIFCILNQIINSKFDVKGISFVKKEARSRIKSLLNDKDYLAIHSAFVGLIKQPSINHTSIGTLRGIKNISRIDVVNFFRDHFKPNEIVISVSGGGFDKEYVYKEIKYYFSGFKESKNKIHFETPLFRKGLYVTEVRKPYTKQSYIYFAFPSFGYSSKNYYAAKVLAYILGGSLDSVLMRDIRTKHGYAYSAFAFNYKLPKGGVFVIGLQTQNKFTMDAIKRVFADIRDISKFINKNSVGLAKDYFSGSIPISLQTPQAVSYYLATAYFENLNGIPWKSFMKKIKSISVEDVKRVADYIFKDGSLSIGIVGYKNFVPDIKKVASEYGYK